MINVAIIDKNKKTSDLISSYLKEIEDINKITSFETIESLSISDENLIIFDINSYIADEMISKIEILKKENPSLHFLATSYEINSELVAKILKNGVDDFLLKPILKNILEVSIKKIFTTSEEKIQNYSKIISLYSAKGGSGVSSIATNIAYEIASQTSKNTCLLNLSQNFEDISNFLNIKQTDINSILNNINKSDKKMILSLIPKLEDANLYCLNMQSDTNSIFKFTPQSIKELISSLRNIFDFIIIDTPSFLDERTNEILNNSNIIIYLTLLNATSTKLAQKTFETFNNIGYEKNKIKILINRYLESSKDKLEELEKEIKINANFKIPNNYLTLIDAINQLKPLAQTNPQANITKAIRNIASELTDIEFENSANKYAYNAFGLIHRRGD